MLLIFRTSHAVLQCGVVSKTLYFVGSGDEGVLMMVPLCRDHQFFFCKGPNSKYFSICGTYGVCHNASLPETA